MQTLIGDHNDYAFQVFMDDHAGSATDFDFIYTLLHEHYFPRCVFGPVYLAGHKIILFANTLQLLGFEAGPAGLRPSRKHLEKIKHWPEPTNREELDAFLQLTPFLRIFIPGRAQLVMEMKKSYLEQVPDDPKPTKQHDDDVEECNKNLTKQVKARHQLVRRKTKPTVRKKWVETGSFHFEGEPQAAFKTVKQAIISNAMSGADPILQYHLATDASESALGGCLFQLHDTPPGTEAGPEFASNERLIMFLSFRLLDPETKYSNSERGCYAIMKCFVRGRDLVRGISFSTARTKVKAKTKDEETRKNGGASSP